MNLTRELDDIYRNRSKFCVLFLSKDYAANRWANYELKSALARAFKETREYVLPGRFDLTEIQGIPDEVAYSDLQGTTPEDFAKIIAERVRALDQVVVPALPPPPPKIRWWQLAVLGTAAVAIVAWLLTMVVPSHTTAKFATADENAIFLSVSNTGWRQSILRTPVLEFRELDMIESEPLTPDKAAAVIIPRRSGGTVRLEVTGLKAKTDALKGKRYTRDQIEPLLLKTKATVLLQIEESNGRPKPIRISVDGARIRDLVHKQLPSDEEY